MITEQTGLLASAGLECWDVTRKRWIMYQDSESHSLDCQLYPFEEMPTRIFIDTSVVNILIKFAGTIFDMKAQDPSQSLPRRQDVEALLHVFAVGASANWDLVASSRTFDEVSQTKDQAVRADLVSYVLEILERGTPESTHGQNLGRRLADSSLLAALPDRTDRELLGNAIGLGCDAFVTADIRTIISRRDRLPQLPLKILTPVEWWRHVKPWGGLWL